MIKNKMILIGGMPASGKTTLGKSLCEHLNLPFLDKDDLCDIYTNYIVAQQTFPNDRSSDLYTKTLRFIEYDILFHVAHQQVKLGLCPVLVAPFTTEFQDPEKIKKIEANLKLQNPKYELVTILLDNPVDVVKRQILSRNRPEDQVKISQWETYIADKKIVQAKAAKNVSLVVSSQTPIEFLINKFNS